MKTNPVDELLYAQHMSAKELLAGKWRELLIDTIIPRSMPDLSKQLVREMANALAANVGIADPFYVSSEVGNTLLEASQTIPKWQLQWDKLPAKRGLIFLEDGMFWDLPPGQEERDFLSMPLRGFLWWRAFFGGKITMLVWPLTWLDGHNVLLPLAVIAWPEGDDQVEAAWRHVQDPEKMNEKNSEQLMWIVYIFCYLSAAFSFMEQKITVQTEQRATRGIRRSLGRDGELPAVKIVTLRKRDYQYSPSDGVPHDWHHRWIVSGHWRQQAAGPGRTERRPVWIDSYLKGPDGKPMLPPRPTVFKVVR